MPQIRHLKMAITRYGLRVAGLRGEDLKNSILKLPLKPFYLATRNAQRVPPSVLKSGGGFGIAVDRDKKGAIRINCLLKILSLNRLAEII